MNSGAGAKERRQRAFQAQSRPIPPV